MNKTKPAPRPTGAPKPAEDVRGHDPAADDTDHARISRQDHEKGRPKNSGREGA
jgi:hypothetical protein